MKKSRREKKSSFANRSQAEPVPSKAEPRQNESEPSRNGTEPSRVAAEPGRNRAHPNGAVPAGTRKARGRHAEGARKAKSRVLEFFAILFRAMPDRSRAGVGPHGLRVGSGSDRHGSARVRSDRVGFGSGARIFSGRRAHAPVEGIKCPTAIYHCFPTFFPKD